MSQMLAEVREAPARVAAMLAQDQDAYAALTRALDARPPAFAATIARGSSDHAASYGAWLLALSTGLATASIPPSLVSRYAAQPRLEHALVLAVSQSGASPDIVRSLQAATATGAITTAIVNQPNSPLAAAARHTLPQNAGEERSVAATKSFILTCTALARLVATWQQDEALTQALHHLPERLEQAIATDWGPTTDLLKDATSLYVLGRGPTHAIAGEAALKLKETCYLHAEAFSSAEVQHGPKAVIDQNFPILALVTNDQGGTDTTAYAQSRQSRHHHHHRQPRPNSPRPPHPPPQTPPPLARPHHHHHRLLPPRRSPGPSQRPRPRQARGLKKVTSTV
jgi:glutamine---fructose-6-phosphate transaminase (isomerizing)